MLKPIKPMLAVVAKEPFDSEVHYFEPKLDGVRALAFIEGKETRLQGRNLHDISSQFPELLDLHQQVKEQPIVLDGEIVCLDESGYPNFSAIQNRIHKTHSLDIKIASRQTPATYFAFDIIYAQNNWITSLPLTERKKLLDSLFRPSPKAYIVKFIEREGINLFKRAQEQGLEGVMAKLKTSPYLPGERSPFWQKFKTKKEDIFVIGGLTFGKGARKETFGAILLGKEDSEGKLHYVGNVGSGFSDFDAKKILELCQKLKTDKSPFINPPNGDEVALWCHPLIKCEIRYIEITPDNKLRFPIYRRLITE